VPAVPAVPTPKPVVRQLPPKKTICVNYIEDEDVIEVDDVTYMGAVQKMDIDGEPVIVSSDDNAVYKIYENRGIGPCIGRWDKEKGLIVDKEDATDTDG
jgi:sulfur carrier protein ThiS